MTRRKHPHHGHHTGHSGHHEPAYPRLYPDKPLPTKGSEIDPQKLSPDQLALLMQMSQDTDISLSDLLPQNKQPMSAKEFSTLMLNHGREILKTSQNTYLGDNHYVDRDVRNIIEHYLETKGKPTAELMSLRHNIAVSSLARTFIPSSFDKAYAMTMKFEGGHANDPNDHGGETIFGIASKSWPRQFHTAMALNDKKEEEMRKDKNSPAAKESQRVLDSYVKNFYHENFWNAIHGDRLPAQMAVRVFDAAVNHGVDDALAFYKQSGNNPQAFLDIRGHRLNAIADNDPTQEGHRKGWNNRVAAQRNLNLDGPTVNGKRNYDVRSLYGVDFAELGGDANLTDQKNLKALTQEVKTFRSEQGEKVPLPVSLVHQGALTEVEQKHYLVRMKELAKAPSQPLSSDENRWLVASLKKQGVLEQDSKADDINDKHVKAALRKFMEKTEMDPLAGKAAAGHMAPALRVALEVYNDRIDHYADLQQKQTASMAQGLNLKEVSKNSMARHSSKEQIIALKEKLEEAGLYHHETKQEKYVTHDKETYGRKGHKHTRTVDHKHTKTVEVAFDDKVDAKLMAAVRTAQLRAGLQAPTDAIVDSVTLAQLGVNVGQPDQAKMKTMSQLLADNKTSWYVPKEDGAHPVDSFNILGSAATVTMPSMPMVSAPAPGEPIAQNKPPQMKPENKPQPSRPS